MVVRRQSVGPPCNARSRSSITALSLNPTTPTIPPSGRAPRVDSARPPYPSSAGLVASIFASRCRTSRLLTPLVAVDHHGRWAVARYGVGPLQSRPTVRARCRPIRRETSPRTGRRPSAHARLPCAPPRFITCHSMGSRTSRRNPARGSPDHHHPGNLNCTAPMSGSTLPTTTSAPAGSGSTPQNAS